MTVPFLPDPLICCWCQQPWGVLEPQAALSTTSANRTTCSDNENVKNELDKTMR